MRIPRSKTIIGNLLKTLVIIIFFLSLIGLCSGQYSYPWLKASYSEDYVGKNKGKVLVEIPEVYELANIAIAISNYKLDNSSKINKRNEYYQQVLKHFLPYKDHPLISEIDFSGKTSFLFRPFRENSACYVFKNSTIIQGHLYPLIRFPNFFKKKIELIEDFAEISQFRKFFNDHLPYYQDQVQKYKKKVPMKTIWTWLEQNFPDNYDCYKIIFSPLTFGIHTTQRFRDGDFREILMFISGPEIYKNRYRGQIEEVLLSRIVFTEIDHNYVNPVTDTYRDAVNKVFADVKIWNKQTGYNSSYLTFNEYMTWAVFLLYTFEKYGIENFKPIKRDVVDQMVNSRKFVKFDEFSEKFLKLYINRKKGATIADLFPGILDWIARPTRLKEEIFSR